MGKTRRRDDPSYKKIEGYIPKKLHSQFKIHTINQESDFSFEIEEALEFFLSKYEGDTIKVSGAGRFIQSILNRERPGTSVIKDTAYELEVEEEKLHRLVTLLFGEENPDIIE